MVMIRNTEVSQVSDLLMARFVFSGFQTINQFPEGSKCYFGRLIYISCCDVAPSSTSSQEEEDKEKFIFC